MSYNKLTMQKLQNLMNNNIMNRHFDILKQSKQINMV